MKTKNIVYMILGFILALSCLTILSPRKALILFNEKNDLDYIMPTLARYRAEFSLKDKDISHTYINPFQAKKEETKKFDNKPQANMKAAQKPRGPVKPVAKKAEPPKNETNTADEQANTDEKKDGEVADSVEIPQGGVYLKNTQIAGGTAVVGQNTVSYWKNRILLNPTKETMNEFLQQYMLGKITKEVFYGTMADLIEDHNPKVQDIALYGLAATPSFESFSQLAVAEDILNGPEKNHASKYLEAYTNKDLLPHLESAMKDQNMVIVSAATGVLVKAIKIIKGMLVPKNPKDQGRYARGEPEYISQNNGLDPNRNPTNLGNRISSYRTNLAKNFNKFIPILRELQQNSNSRISSNAQDALSQLSSIASN